MPGRAAFFYRLAPSTCRTILVFTCRSSCQRASVASGMTRAAASPCSGETFDPRSPAAA